MLKSIKEMSSNSNRFEFIKMVRLIPIFSNFRNSKRKLDQDGDESTKSSKKKATGLIETSLISSTADGIGSFNNLNQDVFEKILTCLHPNDILNFCLTSKSINDTIGNNKQIMKRITLRFPKVDKLAEVNFGQRIYRKISFKNDIRVVDLKTVLPCIKMISSSVRSIDLGGVSVSVGVRILKHFKHIDKIALDVSRLKYLEIYDSRLKLFENCQILETLSLCGHYTEYDVTFQNNFS